VAICNHVHRNLPLFCLLVQLMFMCGHVCVYVGLVMCGCFGNVYDVL